MSIDSLGLTLHDGASSDEDQMDDGSGGGSGEWQVREEDLVRHQKVPRFLRALNQNRSPTQRRARPGSSQSRPGSAHPPSHLFLCHVPIGA